MVKGNRHPRKIVKLQRDGRVLVPEWARVVVDLLGGESLLVSPLNFGSNEPRHVKLESGTRRLITLEVVEED